MSTNKETNSILTILEHHQKAIRYLTVGESSNAREELRASEWEMERLRNLLVKGTDE